MLRTSALGKVQNLQKSALPYVEVSIKYPHLTSIFQGMVHFFLLEPHNPHRTAALLQLLPSMDKLWLLLLWHSVKNTEHFVFALVAWKLPSRSDRAIECFSMSFTACADFHGPPAVRRVCLLLSLLLFCLYDVTEMSPLFVQKWFSCSPVHQLFCCWNSEFPSTATSHRFLSLVQTWCVCMILK